MAKNRTMAIKHNKAKKEGMKETIQNSYADMSRGIGLHKDVLWNMHYIPYK